MSLMMSVSGVRGIVGETMTPALVRELASAFGSHLGGGSVVIGRDSRASGTSLLEGVTEGLRATGCDVVVLGVVSTPGTALMIGEHSASGGMVITASHNPGEWNGIKFLTAEGFAPPPEEANSIFARYHNKNVNIVDSAHEGSMEIDDSTHELHVAKVLGILDVESIRRCGFTVVLDSINGAGGFGGRVLLERLGCRVEHINAEPSGIFAHTPEPTQANLVGLCDAVRAHDADIGFAQDPDADRLAVVDNTGRYIGEEYTLALSAKFILGRTPGRIAANLSTSRMVDDIAAGVGGAASVVRTAVGEANVARAVLDQGCVLGGEGNGGVIDPRVVAVRDSFVGMGLILNLLAKERRSLGTIVDEMPRYVMIKQKFDVPRPEIEAWLRRVSDTLDGRHNRADGLRIDWSDGWVHVRPSNTEPIARVIAEGADESVAARLAGRVTELL